MGDQIRFGDFVKDKRQKREIPLSIMAKELQLSTTYLSDIEHNRRKPIAGQIKVLIKLLDLSIEDQDLLNDLAGKARKEVPPDLSEYILDFEVSPRVRTALRQARRYAITIEDWDKFIEKIEAKG